MKVIIFLAMAAAAQAGIFPDLSHDWNALRVTWTPNPFNSWGFNTLPRTLAENKDFEFVDDLCKTDGKFVGQRYQYKKDPVLSLLFDSNGYIAGIQTSILKSKFNRSPKNLNYVEDGDYYTLSAYFIDPSKICAEGRSKEEFQKTGTGTGLWIQTGPSALTDTFNVPAEEKNVQKPWGYGKCFPSMGKHYWKNITTDMNCADDLVPNCLLYNGGKLNAFCFAINGNYPNNRYDNPHPDAKAIKLFMDPLPDCFTKQQDWLIESTIHVYFSATPQLSSNC